MAVRAHSVSCPAIAIAAARFSSLAFSCALLAIRLSIMTLRCLAVVWPNFRHNVSHVGQLPWGVGFTDFLFLANSSLTRDGRGNALRIVCHEALGSVVPS